jgi:hypothetical protein
MKKSIRIKGFIYDISTEEDIVVLTPRTNGSTATSNIEYSDYAYTHAGKVFQAAVRKAKEIATEIASN